MSFNDFGRSTGIVETSNANQYREILGNEFYRQIWLSTLRLTVQAAALTVGIGAVVAYGMWRSGPRLRGILPAVILAPLLVSGVARAYGWIAVAGPTGPGGRTEERRVGKEGDSRCRTRGYPDY